MSDLKFLTIYGASDDLMEVTGYVEDEFGAWGSPTTVIVTDPSGARLAVTVEHDPLNHPLRSDDEDAAWVVSAACQGSAWPHPFRFGASPYRATEVAVFLDVPEGTTVTLWGGDQR